MVAGRTVFEAKHVHQLHSMIAQQIIFNLIGWQLYCCKYSNHDHLCSYVNVSTWHGSSGIPNDEYVFVPCVAIYIVTAANVSATTLDNTVFFIKNSYFELTTLDSQAQTNTKTNWTKRFMKLQMWCPTGTPVEVIWVKSPPKTWLVVCNNRI